MSHRTRPGALHIVRTQAFALQQLQRGNELAAKEVCAPGVTGQRRQGVQGGHAAEIGAEIGLQAPEGHQIVAGHAVVPLQLRKEIAVLRIQRPPLLDSALGYPRVEILGKGLHELGLLAVQFQHPFLLLHAGYDRVHDVRRHPGRPRLILQCQQALRKTLFRPGRNTGQQAYHNDHFAQQHDTHHPVGFRGYLHQPEQEARSSLAAPALRESAHKSLYCAATQRRETIP